MGRVFRWCVVLLALGGCSKQLVGREPMLRTMQRGCERQKADLRGATCECLVRESTKDFTDEELKLWMSEPQLFEESELVTLLTRRATSCLKPAALSGCTTNIAQCTCVVTRVFDEFEGDAIIDVVDRAHQGRALPPEFASISLECSRRGK